MKRLTFPITEKDISQLVGRSIHAPILVGDLTSLGLDQAEFLNFFSPVFQTLPWDPYDARRLRIEFLENTFPAAQKEIRSFFKAYYQGEISLTALEPWVQQLTPSQAADFAQIQPWRRRSVAGFYLSEKDGNITIERTPVEQFSQQVADEDFRSWPRIFAEADTAYVEQVLFSDLLRAVFEVVKARRPNLYKIHLTSHFMSVRATEKAPGDNSPEGAHEDGADFIVSALVINRFNVAGGESQILEKLKDGQKEIIFKQTLAPGEFIFQADTGEEIIYGNDLWHHVTPFHLADSQRAEGWRDIIGFDIVLVEKEAS
ncbi:MAG: 2OG-Fe dioxygenase family protein [Saprospiraceae bacterium]